MNKEKVTEENPFDKHPIAALFSLIWSIAIVVLYCMGIYQMFWGTSMVGIVIIMLSMISSGLHDHFDKEWDINFNK